MDEMKCERENETEGDGVSEEWARERDKLKEGKGTLEWLQVFADNGSPWKAAVGAEEGCG